MKDKENFLSFILHTSNLILQMFTPFTVTGCCLELLKPGEQGKVIFYQTQDEKILKQITSIGIKLGSYIKLEQQLPSLSIKFKGQTIGINQQTARTIYVRIVES